MKTDDPKPDETWTKVELDPRVIADTSQCKHFFINYGTVSCECKHCGLGVFNRRAGENGRLLPR